MSPAGCSGKPVRQKLGLVPGRRVRAVDPPADYAALIGAEPGLVGPPADEGIELLHLFARDRAALAAQLAAWLPRSAPGGMLWVSWPKKSSPLYRELKAARADAAALLDEDGVRELCLPLGWVDVKVCAIDADWSGLKLLRRRAR